MQNYRFHKYQGTGNDFIVIDNRKKTFNPENHALIKHLCNRKFGIGADGLILIQDHEEYDFEMVYFNADATQSMCGNGARCAVHYANSLRIIDDSTYFLATDGPHEATLKGGLIYLKMADVLEVKEIGEDLFINTGSPHYLCFIDDVINFDVVTAGRKIRNSESFIKEGTNVNFIEQVGDNEIFVRTYERGVEDETLSCGTGVTAASLAGSKKGLKSPVKLKTLGGELQVSFTKVDENSFTDVYLIGPAEMVFVGNIVIPS